MEVTLTKTQARPLTIGQMVSKVRAYYKAKYLRREAEAYFAAQVHHCCRVSANNRSLSYVIRHVGPFGGPRVEQIDRPKVVTLSETADYVIVKDGYVYELRKDER